MILARFEAEFIAERGEVTPCREGGSGRDDGSVRRKALAEEGDLPVCLSEILAPRDKNMRFVNAQQDKVFPERFVPKNVVDFGRCKSFCGEKDDRQLALLDLGEQVSTFRVCCLQACSGQRDCLEAKFNDLPGLECISKIREL